jgi:hypothetical protein
VYTAILPVFRAQLAKRLCDPSQLVTTAIVLFFQLVILNTTQRGIHMKHAGFYKKCLQTILSLMVGSVFCANALADSDLKTQLPGKLENIKYSKDFKIRGWEVSKGVYWGQAKIAGKYGVGLVIDRKSYSWGINNRGVGFLKRF